MSITRLKFGRSLLLSIALLVAPATVAAAPSGWVKVATNSRDKLDIYVDNGTMQKNGPFRYYWLYLTSSVGQPIDARYNVYGMSLYVSTDCQSGIVRFRSREMIDQKGQPIQGLNMGDAGPLAQFNRNSPVGRSIFNYVCKW